MDAGLGATSWLILPWWDLLLLHHISGRLQPKVQMDAGAPFKPAVGLGGAFRLLLLYQGTTQSLIEGK
jgi:hypothetical protein